MVIRWVNYAHTGGKKWQEKQHTKTNMQQKTMTESVLCCLKAASTAKTGGSINGYVNQAINERLQKDGFPVMQRQEQEGAGEP